MTTPAIAEKIILNFGWEGPSTWQGGWSEGGLDVGVVDLLFKNAKTDISVHIPDNICAPTVKKLPFTCRRYHETEKELKGHKFKPLAQETHPDLLKVTTEQIRNLTIKAGIFEESPHTGRVTSIDSSGKMTREKRVLRSDREVKLQVPEELEMGQVYSLVVTSNDFSLSARLLKEEVRGPLKDEGRASKNEFQTRLKKMSTALIAEGLQNLNLASQGEVGVFDSTSSNADLFAHGMQGIVRSGQQMHSEIRVPYTKPSESSSELHTWSVDELQSCFEATFEKDKQFETQRMRAAMAGNLPEMNRIIAAEHANSQLLIMLAEVLERKGVKAQIPQTESFQSAANQSKEAETEALKKIEERCKMQ